MDANKLIKDIASVLGDNFNLTLEDVANQETEEDQEIVYGLICLHDDLHFYKEQSDLLLTNFKNTLFNSAAVSITNSKGKIKDLNDFFLDLSGYSKNELLSKELEIIDSKDNQTADYGQLTTCITGGHTWRGEVCSVKKNGDIFWLNTHVFPIKNTEGIIYEYWSVSIDITYKKSIESKLVEKSKEMEHFSYMISHDLKAPARQIQQLVEVFEEDHKEALNDDGIQLLNHLGSRANRLNNLIDGILKYSLVDKTDTTPVELDLNNIINDIVSGFDLPEKVEIIITNPLPTIKGNKIKIAQVFENLLGNAVKYLDKETGEIMISSTQSTEYFRFEIKDNGAGIKEKYLDSIFTIFETAHESSRDDSTGIGLAVVKKIIDSYGGEIGCLSEIKKGSTFWFTLPKL